MILISLNSNLANLIILKSFSNATPVTVQPLTYYANYKVAVNVPTGYKYLAMVDFTCQNYGQLSWVNAAYSPSEKTVSFLIYNHSQEIMTTGAVTAKILFIKDI